MSEVTNLNILSYDGEEPYIFVSYSHADQKKVFEILSRVEREKFRFWYDDSDCP